MKKFGASLLLLCLAIGFVAPSAEARRLGAGGNIGRQSASPAMREAPREAPRAAPAPSQPAPAAPIASGAPARPGFMNRWGGVIAGVGMGALLGSMFGGGLGGGSALGGLLNILLVVGVLYLAYRFFVSRRRGAGASAPMQFAGAGGPSFDAGFHREPVMPPAAGRTLVAPALNVPAGFDVEPFVRQAHGAFIRLQAANDDGDLADLRATTTPEVFAELAMQLRERGDAPQKTEVVALDAQLLEVVTEDGMTIASLRYSGTIREAVGAPAAPFAEIWHLRRPAVSPDAPWLIAGIQQAA